MHRLVRPFLTYTVRMSFYYVYVLKSLVKDWIYVGYTLNIPVRLSEHNAGKTLSTSKYKPFELIHYEAYKNMKDAKRREMYLKTTKGKTTLRTMIREYLSSL